MDSGQAERMLNRSDISIWNDYREKNPDWVPDLSGRTIAGDMRGANLRGANLCGTNLTKASMTYVKLEGASFSEETAFPQMYDATSRGATFIPDCELDPHGTNPDAPQVFYVESDKPFTARRNLTEICKDVSGSILVCDPYYGTGTFVGLGALLHCDEIRFLTKIPDGKESKTGILPRTLLEFVKEHRNVEFRAHAGNDLHDRYILTDSELIILGHGVKDMGNKDSLIIRIPANYIQDTVDAMRTAFDQKWLSAMAIS
ncbi:MAG: hypothetical protein DRR06_17810 [Gammaproteobacteria bacterium]|nr:MAG: hypothetical protein DRR06_17810 [Gammaproteobacteria bacterium]RLA51838.1 MAG: hypothetical protein DRR42_09270 [Gammaproteobacteria bacterium]